MKVKGLKLNEKTLDIITIEKMVDMAMSYTRQGDEREVIEVKVPQLQFKVDQSHVIITKQI